MDRWQKWRSYSCPTNDLLADLIQEQDNKDDDDEEVFEVKSMKDYALARSGFPLTYLGSLPVRGIHKPCGHNRGRGVVQVTT